MSLEILFGTRILESSSSEDISHVCVGELGGNTATNMTVDPRQDHCRATSQLVGASRVTVVIDVYQRALLRFTCKGSHVSSVHFFFLRDETDNDDDTKNHHHQHHQQQPATLQRFNMRDGSVKGGT